MIHDAQVEVTCDRDGCGGNEIVELHYVYGGIMGTDGHYDSSDDAIIKSLKKQNDEWVFSEDDNKHFCSETCATAAGYKWQ